MLHCSTNQTSPERCLGKGGGVGKSLRGLLSVHGGAPIGLSPLFLPLGPLVYRGGGGELVRAYFGKAKLGEGKFWYKVLHTMEKCGTVFPKSGHTGNWTRDF